MEQGANYNMNVRPTGLTKLLALDKVKRLMDIIKFNGGIRRTLFVLYKMEEAKLGKFIGEDKYGNKYYENNMYFYGRNRWVAYTNRVGIDYDGSQVPAEWFGWLHYKTDLPPTEDPCRVQHPWMADHTENLTGTKYAYMPYSTTRPKIEPYKPPSDECSCS